MLMEQELSANSEAGREEEGRPWAQERAFLTLTFMSTGAGTARQQ